MYKTNMTISANLISRNGRPANAGNHHSFGKLGRLPRLAGALGIGCILLQFSVSVEAAEVTYADLSPILGSRCVMCHSGSAAPLGLRLDSLDGLLAGSQNGPILNSSNPASSELVLRLKGSSLPRMPMTGPPYLSDAQVTRFEQWIAGGMQPGSESENTAPADASSTQENPETSGLTLYGDVALIFATRCAKCHAANGLMGPAPEGYQLTSYAATVSTSDRVRVVPGNPLASELLRRIRGQARPRMPLDGPPYLTEAEIQSIEHWIADGARDSEGNPAPIPTGQRLRLHGTLDNQWRLDGLPLVITGSTRMDKNPRPGSYVRVRGRIRGDGQIVAERVKRR
ncbi:MAG: mono/diheme cytochrome c family protein [Gammaproteobacteria bacterium]|jgi:mono/diheme cytochrome c family protein